MGLWQRPPCTGGSAASSGWWPRSPAWSCARGGDRISGCGTGVWGSGLREAAGSHCGRMRHAAQQARKVQRRYRQMYADARGWDMGRRIRAAPRVRLCDCCRERPCRTQADPRARRASVLHLRWLFLALPGAAPSRPGEARHGAPPSPGAMCLTLHGVLSTVGRIAPICAGQRPSVPVRVFAAVQTREGDVGGAVGRSMDDAAGALIVGLHRVVARWMGRRLARYRCMGFCFGCRASGAPRGPGRGGLAAAAQVHGVLPQRLHDAAAGADPCRPA
jgi:hypothetical protein